MANQAAKKRAAQNAETISRFKKITLVTLVIFLVVRVGIFWDTFKFWQIFGFIIELLSLGFGLKTISSYGSPTYSEDGQLISGGEDLSSGLFEYVTDVLYISWFVLIAANISDWFFLTYAVVPLFAIYKLFSSLIIPFFSSGGSGNEIIQDEKKKVRRRKVKTFKR